MARGALSFAQVLRLSVAVQTAMKDTAFARRMSVRRWRPADSR